MNILSVETATGCQSIAILRGDDVAAFLTKHAEGSHAKWIIPTIDAALESAGLALRDLDGIAVSIGPGSFTGLRVGLATVLGLRAVTRVPLVAVPTLEAMAWNLREEGPDLCPIIKARAGEAYWAVYRWAVGDRLVQVQEARIGPVELIPPSLTRSTVMLGDGWLAHESRLRSLLAAGAVTIRGAPAEHMFPSAIGVARAGKRRLEQGEVLPSGLAPLYVQRSEAELNWERPGRLRGRAARAKRVRGLAPSR